MHLDILYDRIVDLFYRNNLFFVMLKLQFSDDMIKHGSTSNTEMKKKSKIALLCGNKFSKRHWNAKDISVKILIAFLFHSAQD